MNNLLNNANFKNTFIKKYEENCGPINNLKLIVKKKNVYGNELIYPVCRKAELFCYLFNKKTFGTFEISILKMLGYSFTHQAEEI